MSGAARHLYLLGRDISTQWFGGAKGNATNAARSAVRDQPVPVVEDASPLRLVLVVPARVTLAAAALPAGVYSQPRRRNVANSPVATAMMTTTLSQYPQC